MGKLIDLNCVRGISLAGSPGVTVSCVASKQISSLFGQEAYCGGRECGYSPQESKAFLEANADLLHPNRSKVKYYTAIFRKHCSKNDHHMEGEIPPILHLSLIHI